MLSFKAQNLTLGAKEGVFGVASRAEQAKKSQPIIDSTLGVAYDDNGKLFTLKTVEQLLSNPEQVKKALSYAGILGLPSYNAHLPRLALKSELPEIQNSGRKIDAFATHGGTGALAVALHLFAERNVITGTPCWETYEKIAQAQQVRLITFPLLQKNSSNTFSLNIPILKKTLTALPDNTSASLLLNHPCQNPTGYTPSREEWEAIADFIRSASSPKNLSLILDLAYHEYASNPDDRSFITLLSKTCPDLTIAIAMSNSKTYTMYGYRAGGLIILHPQNSPIEGLDNHVRGFIRGTYSNVARLPQEVITAIETSEQLKKQAEEERGEIRAVLMKRGKVFIETARENNVPIVTDKEGKFSGGFFGFVPILSPEKAKQIGEALEHDNTFFLTLPEGLRIAICSMSEPAIRSGIRMICKKMTEFGTA